MEESALVILSFHWSICFSPAFNSLSLNSFPYTHQRSNHLLNMADHVFLQCVAEGSRLRVRIISPGYFNDANCQFPRSIREEGRYFSVPASSVRLAYSRNSYFYRVSQPIHILDGPPSEESLSLSTVWRRVNDIPSQPNLTPDTITEPPSSRTRSSRKRKQPEPPTPAIKLPTKVFTDENEPDCLICLDEHKEVVFVPCGHYCLCQNCIAKLTAIHGAQRKCPVCRTVIQSTVKPSEITTWALHFVVISCYRSQRYIFFLSTGNTKSKLLLCFISLSCVFYSTAWQNK
jgi:hypothetical protein